MPDPVLRYRSGFVRVSPELQNDVKRLQRALLQAGHKVDTDGRFGKGTLRAVKAFQRAQGLQVDGIVGRGTWRALKAAGQAAPKPTTPKPATPLTAPEAPEGSLLKGFRGDLSWVHAREGHAGKTYWPGGASGVTLDPGVDLGHAKPDLIETAYASLLSAEQLAAVRRVYGIKGQRAKNALAAGRVLRSIRISRAQADDIFQFAALPYWDAIRKRFPALSRKTTLPAVQTVMLSLAYNRGAGNRGLASLAQPIQDKDWAKVADIVGNMQQRHRLVGIRIRRRMEANLIRKALR